MLLLYQNIKKRRLKLGMSQTELAHKLGYADKGMISKIESGRIDLPLSKVEAFAKALRTEPKQLMGWESEQESDDTDSKLNELIDVFDNLNQDGQTHLLKIAKTYLPEE